MRSRTFIKEPKKIKKDLISVTDYKNGIQVHCESLREFAISFEKMQNKKIFLLVFFLYFKTISVIHT